MRALLDTSVLIADRDGVALTIPDEVDEFAVSVVSVAELAVGVLVATDAEERGRWLDALSAVERTYDPLPVTTDVAHAYARLVANVRRAGRNPRVMDTLVAATAVANECVVLTRDADFAVLEGVPILRA